ncbi:glycosyl hydrolase [uncultured Draconibacterium sp.]|uniref:glycosyl hydrolase n=1 Tax=uncultured Draconibacterium sp. TaxID=1573823 RepID=UPI0029C7CF6C|nr:glycosyl hydrolase [uncultured Draconibacterium sp.]
MLVVLTGYSNPKYNGRRVSPEVKNILIYLKSVNGKQMLSGQEEANSNGLTTEMDYIKNITGKLPAVRGFDVRTDVPDPTGEAIKSWKERHQLITFSWHMGAPPLEDSYPNSKEPVSINEVLKPGTPENEIFISKLNAMAERLAILKENKVPVLWRPFHEMNGSWFWWGPKKGTGNDGAQFVKLWQFMFDYFYHDKKLDNLIWVWGGSYEADASFYPGEKYVDIVGTDTYHHLDHKRWAKEFKILKTIAPGKLVALTENDRIPYPEEADKLNTNWIWFLTWHTQWLRENSTEDLIKIYKHPAVVTADEMPDLSK